MTELDGLIAEENDEGRDGRPPSQADILVALAEAAELFHTPDDVAYADIEVGEHRETWPVQSRGFRRWLKRRFFEEMSGAPNGEAVASALGVIEAKAQHDTPVREVFVRVGELDGKIYLDLCDAEWRAVEIDETGWRVVDRPTVRFRRTPDMRPLPEPEEGGSVDGLRPLLNIPEDEKAKPGEAQGHGRDDDFILAIAYRAGLPARRAVPIRSWRSAASRAARNRPGRRCCAAWSIRGIRGCAACRVTSGTWSSRRAISTCWRSTTYPACGRGCRTPSAASPPGPGSAPASSTPTPTRLCSPAPVRSSSTASRRSSSGRTSPSARFSPLRADQPREPKIGRRGLVLL